jgi:hypothetical protein
MSDAILLDMLIVAKLSKNCTEKSYYAIADIALLMKKEKRDIVKISQIAAIVLRQDTKEIGLIYQEVVECDRKYGYYLQEIKGWKEILNKAKQYQISYRSCPGAFSFKE